MEAHRTTEMDIDIQQAIVRLDEAVLERQRCIKLTAAEAEKIICIETRSLLVVFKDLTLWKGAIDRALANQVMRKLEESRKALSTDKLCISSVDRRIKEFQSFVQKTQSTVEALSAEEPQTAGVNKRG